MMVLHLLVYNETFQVVQGRGLSFKHLFQYSEAFNYSEMKTALPKLM